LTVLPKYAGVTNEDWNAYAYEFFIPSDTVPKIDAGSGQATRELSTVEETRKIN